MPVLYTNARVFSGYGTTFDGFAVEDGRFLAVGNTEELTQAYPDAEVIDLNGKFVCAGFNDSHMHLLGLGTQLCQAQLAPHSDSLSHVMKALSQYANDHPDAPFIIGRGWNQDDFYDEHRFPTRDDLDSVCPDRPCLITRACGHVAVANSTALSLAAIDEHAVSVDGGCVYVDENGRPTGVLSENAISLVSTLIPKPDRREIKRRLCHAIEFVHSYGITSVQTDDFSSVDVPFEEIIEAYLELKREGKLTVRVTEQCNLPTMDLLNRFLDAGYVTGWGDEFFRIGPLKLLADGSLGARTALLRAPYADSSENIGISTFSPETIDALVLRAHQAGMQIAIHAIGDGACDLVLDAFEHAWQAHPRSDARHGIVHAQVVTSEQIARMKKLGLHAYIQSIFLDYDSQIVHSRLGNRASEAYPAASLLRNGIPFSNGSDSPVELPSVLGGIQCAITRASFSRPAKPTYLPHEALTLSQALQSFTSAGAYASFEEHIKGQIAPGQLADFVVLAIDPFETDPLWLHQIPVQSTYFSGKKVFERS